MPPVALALALLLAGAAGLLGVGAAQPAQRAPVDLAFAGDYSV
jgi:hypothetical protein